MTKVIDVDGVKVRDKMIKPINTSVSVDNLTSKIEEIIGDYASSSVVCNENMKKELVICNKWGGNRIRVIIKYE
jgi:hypothetical protein